MQRRSTVVNTALCCLLTLLSLTLSGQSSRHLSSRFSGKETWFDSIVGVANSGIVNGPEYILYVKGAKTHPFFLTGETSGKVIMQDQIYVAPIKYDTHSQALVLRHVGHDSSSRLIELEKEKVIEFELFGHRFKNFEGRGFYDVLLETNSLSLAVNRTKKTFIKDRMLDFYPTDFFYLYEEGKWTVLRKKSSIVKLGGTREKSRLLRKFMRGQRIKRGGFFDEAKLIKVIVYYDTLRKQSS